MHWLWHLHKSIQTPNVQNKHNLQIYIYTNIYTYISTFHYWCHNDASWAQEYHRQVAILSIAHERKLAPVEGLVMQCSAFSSDR